MKNVAELKVPLLAEVGIGKNWDEAHYRTPSRTCGFPPRVSEGVNDWVKQDWQEGKLMP
jgi:hypothetical protein